MILYELSRLILPTSEFINNENLFVNKEIKSCQFKNQYKAVHYYKFNTWMNIFPAKKYFYYCNLEDLYLDIELDIDAEVLVYGFNYNEAFEDCDELIIKTQLTSNEAKQIKISSASSYENVFFCIICDSENINIKKAAWSTSTPSITQNKLALICCTYKRENYVYKNVQLFNNFIKLNPKISDRIKLFIVDNGKTLEKDIENNNIKLIPNKNTGGAGGFTRGIIEAKRSSDNYTRILLMDDDVEVFPESFYRTLILSDYLKPEFKNSFIHGAMLNLYAKNLFFESTAIKNLTWCYSYHGGLDVSKQFEIGKSNYTPTNIFNDEVRKVSSAWWYCCFSMESILEKGLPLPVFFRCDDLEWSWRNYGEHHITANGICVWHAPFAWRVSKPVEYYFSKRNIAMINMLYTPNYKDVLLAMFEKDFKHLLKILDYTSCKIYLRMMNDLLMGSEIYRKDPELILKEIMQYVNEDKIFDTLDQHYYNKLKTKLEKLVTLTKRYRRVIYFIKKAFWEISLQGRLIPISLWKRKKDVWSKAPSEEYLFAQRVYTWNFATHKTELREYNYGTVKILKKQFRTLLKQFNDEYEFIKNDFCNAKDEFITEEFWSSYLNIES